MSENKKSKQSAYEQQESRLSAQSVAFIKLLTQRGILGDAEIDDDKIRQAQKEKKTPYISQHRNAFAALQGYCVGAGVLPLDDCGGTGSSPGRFGCAHQLCGCGNEPGQ